MMIAVPTFMLSSLQFHMLNGPEYDRSGIILWMVSLYFPEFKRTLGDDNIYMHVPMISRSFTCFGIRKRSASR